MELEEAKKEVSEIIRKVVHGEEVYYLDGKYVRWGRVEKDLHAVLERLLTQRAADEGYAPLEDHDPTADIERISKEGFPKSLRR